MAVAEEGNFTRAAERLLMTQGALSRAIRTLESVVGTALLVRGYREVTPTVAGEVLLRQARDLDELAETAVRLARSAGARAPRLAVTAPGSDVSVLDELVSSYNLAAPSVPAVPLVVAPQDQAAQVREGIADVALMRDLSDGRGLDSDELFSEPRVVLLPEDHTLAARCGLELAQLTGSAVIRPGEGREDCFLLWPPAQVGAAPWVAGPVIDDTCQIRAFVRLGHGIAFVPESIGAGLTGNGVRAVRVLDCPPSTMRIVWRQDSTSPVVSSLVRHAVASLGDDLDEATGLELSRTAL